MTTATLPEDVLARIEKLLAMSTENGATENEAITASNMVNKILQEYSIGIEDVILGSKSNAEIGMTHEVIQLGKEYGKDRQFEWKMNLFHMLAKHNDCDMILNTRLRNVTVMGFEANIKATKTLGEWLITQYWSMITKDWSDHKARMGLKGQEARAANEGYKESYFKAMTYRIGQRLADMKEQIMSTALVVKVDERLKEYKAEQFPMLGLHRAKRSTYNAHGHSAGMRAGGRVDIGQTKIRAGMKALN